MPALRHTLHARFMSPLQGCDEDEDEDKTRYGALVMHTYVRTVRFPRLRTRQVR